VAGCDECGDEPSGSCATELVISVFSDWLLDGQRFKSWKGKMFYFRYYKFTASNVHVQ
jgi:hypothetical protein